jgi:hypothetical protein
MGGICSTHKGEDNTITPLKEIGVDWIHTARIRSNGGLS